MLDLTLSSVQPLIVSQVQELVIDYTDCVSAGNEDFVDIPSSKVSSSFKSSNSTVRPQWKTSQNRTTPPYSVPIDRTNVCTLQFSIPNDIGPPVYLYYRLTNFYQNHRRYVKSLDTDQLKGDFISNGSIGGSSCNPIRIDHDTGKAIYPCGLIANSLFNDTLNSPVAVNRAGSQSSETYTMTNRSIAWGSDAELYKKTKYQYYEVSPPPNWRDRYPDGYTAEHGIPDLAEYEEFQVWMRTAGLPTFSKLALRNDDDVMRAGIYQMDIFDCKLELPDIISSSDQCSLPRQSLRRDQERLDLNPYCRWWKELLLGHCLCRGWRTLHCAWCFVHHCTFDQTKVRTTLPHEIDTVTDFSRKLGDHTYLSWNNDTPATAVASGREVRPAGA